MIDLEEEFQICFETEGLSKIAKAYRHSKLQEDSDFMEWNYMCSSNGFKWYTAIYHYYV